LLWEYKGTIILAVSTVRILHGALRLLPVLSHLRE
jgi:hypothetical protein